MKSSKRSLSAQEKGQPAKVEKQAKEFAQPKLNSMADLATLRLQKAVENAEQNGIAKVQRGEKGWIVEFTPLV